MLDGLPMRRSSHLRVAEPLFSPNPAGTVSGHGMPENKFDVEQFGATDFGNVISAALPGREHPRFELSGGRGAGQAVRGSTVVSR
jgi:hypothetical protein